MKYIVTAKQELKYTETIVGVFDDLAEVQQFIETLIQHFEEISVSIKVDTESVKAE